MSQNYFSHHLYYFSKRFIIGNADTQFEESFVSLFLFSFKQFPTINPTLYHTQIAKLISSSINNGNKVKHLIALPINKL